MAKKAAKALSDIVSTLLTLQDLGEHMKESPFSGWTMQACVFALTAKIRMDMALIPTDAKTAKPVRALLREAQVALDLLDETVELLDADFDDGMKNCGGAAGFGAAVESFTIKAGTAIEAAGASMGAIKSVCFFDTSPEKARTA
jgi:hypothetical protein